MKKFLSLCVSAVLAVSSVPFFTANAVGEETVDSITIFGDSIASGYSVDESLEYNYGEILGDYLGADVANYADPGDTTTDLLAVIDGLTDAQKNNVVNTDVVIVSIGGNDLMQFAANHLLKKFILKKAAADKTQKWKWFNGDWSVEKINKEFADKPVTITDLMKIVNFQGEKGLIDHAKADISFADDLNNAVLDMSKSLRIEDADDGSVGYIPNTVIPNIKTAVGKIKAINPNARVIVQTIYQPLQFDKVYLDAEGIKPATVEYITLNLFRQTFEKIIDSFRTNLNGVDGIEVADIYALFTSLGPDEEQGMKNAGNSFFFTGMTKSGDERDFHPNQRGHLAIATSLIDLIGIQHEDKTADGKKGLLTTIFNQLPDEGRDTFYPEIAYKTFQKASVGYKIHLGDVNFDGKVDSIDAASVLRYSTFVSSNQDGGYSAVQKQAANINNSTSTIDSNDAAMILRYSTYVSSNGREPIEEYYKDIRK